MAESEKERPADKPISRQDNIIPYRKRKKRYPCIDEPDT
jgi:hypothetical protein